MDLLFEKIKSLGGRLTKTRKAIIETLVKRTCLTDKKTLIKELNKINITPDRSTIYRELLFLIKNNIIQGTIIGGLEYYEIPQNHHHHLICLNCNNIEKVEMDHHLKKEENIISKKHKFDIVNHTLEFYGYCSSCQS